MSNIDHHLPENNNPFRVPEGYFESLKERVMRQIPEENTAKKARRVVMWRRVATRAAAVAAFVVMGLGAFYLSQHDDADVQQLATSYESVGNDPVDQVADYIMCDNHDLYAYISGE